MKLFLVAIFAFLTFKQVTADTDFDWELFKVQFGKTYTSEEEEDLHKQIYINTMEMIEEHNKQYTNGDVSFELHINEFADLTDDEYEAKLSTDSNDEIERVAFAQNFEEENLTDSVNWIEYGCKISMLNKEECENSYISAAIAALEGQYFIKYDELIQLSHQELLDCSKKYGNHGCDGGHAQSNPYLGYEDVCRKGQPRISIGTFYQIPKGDEQALKQAVATIGPIPINVDAILDTFRYYQNGVYYDSRCRTNSLLHSMIVVGYGTEIGQDYWLVKKWGERWGDNGYIKIARNHNNHCGVASRTVYPIVN